MNNNDALREALKARLRAAMQDDEHSHGYRAGVQDCLNDIEALAASKPEQPETMSPRELSKRIEAGERWEVAAIKPEPQAQALDRDCRPMTFGGCPFCGRQDCVAGQCRYAGVSSEHVHKNAATLFSALHVAPSLESGPKVVLILNDQEFITLQAHREAMAEVTAKWTSESVEVQKLLLNLEEAQLAIAKQAAALQACVEAMKRAAFDLPTTDIAAKERAYAAITQAERALK